MPSAISEALGDSCPCAPNIKETGTIVATAISRTRQNDFLRMLVMTYCCSPSSSLRIRRTTVWHSLPQACRDDAAGLSRRYNGRLYLWGEETRLLFSSHRATYTGRIPRHT